MRTADWRRSNCQEETKRSTKTRISLRSSPLLFDSLPLSIGELLEPEQTQGKKSPVRGSL